MTVTTQAYPLWCAVLDDDRTIRTGRVIAWHAPHAATCAPVVAFDDDGQFTDAHTVTGRLFLGDTRDRSLSAAMDARRAEAAYARARSAEPPPKRDTRPTVRATNPPSMAVRVGDAELALGASHPLFSRIDLIAERGRELVVIPGEPERPEHAAQRPPLPAGCEFLAYVHVHRGAVVILDANIETDVPVYCEDR